MTKGFEYLQEAARGYRSSQGHRHWLENEFRSGTLVVCLPLPPSINHAFPTRNGRRVKSPEYMRWNQEATLVANAAGVPFVPSRPVPVSWSLDTYFVMADWRSDMDNRYKVLIDWLCRRLALTDNRLLQQFSARLPNDREHTGVEAMVHVW